MNSLKSSLVNLVATLTEMGLDSMPSENFAALRLSVQGARAELDKAQQRELLGDLRRGVELTCGDTVTWTSEHFSGADTARIEEPGVLIFRGEDD